MRLMRIVWWSEDNERPCSTRRGVGLRLTAKPTYDDGLGSRMPSVTIDRLIINPPYEEPGQHWQYDRETRLFASRGGQERLNRDGGRLAGGERVC